VQAHTLGEVGISGTFCYVFIEIGLYLVHNAQDKLALFFWDAVYIF